MAFDWKSLVSSVAPTIATALGGPFAGLGIKALSAAVLGHEDGDEDQIAAQLAGASPELLLEMKKADQNFKVTMKSLDIKIEDLHAKDRISARERQKALKDHTPAILAFVLTAGLFIVIYFLFNIVIPEGNKEVILLLVGSLGTGCASSWSYFHGSSSGSKQKDVIAKM